MTSLPIPKSKPKPDEVYTGPHMRTETTEIKKEDFNERIFRIMNSGSFFYINIIVGMLFIISAMAGFYIMFLNWHLMAFADKIKSLALNVAIVIGGLVTMLIGMAIVANRKKALAKFTPPPMDFDALSKQFKEKK